MIGQTISHFKVLEKLGGGGMGVVYLADDLSLNRKVALKFLPPHLSTDSEANERFVQEANAASSLNHANVCTIYEIGETGDDQTFIAMAHYEGETLKAKLERGALPTEEAADIARQVAEGLSAAHEKGIIHRDIKPANIFITKRGRAVILDFGLAKLTGALDLTKTGSTLGTAYYMSPEQIRGERLDHRTDVWSLGVVLYEMLSGQRPFTGEYDQAISYAILNEEPPRLMDQSAFLEGIVGQALRKKAGERTESASKLAERLNAAEASADTRSIPPSNAAWTEARRRVAAAVIALVLVAAGAIWIWPQKTSQTAESEKISLVVLPFENIGSPEFQFMGRGIAEEIAARIMSVRDIELRATRSALDLVRQGKPLAEIARDLEVEFVLDGSVQATESRVRLSPKLIRVVDEVQVWGDTYDGNSQDALEFQSRVAAAVVDNLGITLGIKERNALMQRPTKNEQAYQAYLQAQSLSDGDLDVLDERLRLLETACDLDSTFIEAQVERTFAYARRNANNNFFDQPKDAAAKARAAAATVSRLSPGSAESYLAQGFVDFYVDLDYESALDAFKTSDAIRRADFKTTRALGYIQRRLGRPSEALAYLERAFVLDPKDAEVLSAISEVHRAVADFDKALVWIDRAIALDPSNPGVQVAKASLLWGTGDFEGASRVLNSSPRLKESGAWMWIHWLRRDFDNAYEQLRTTNRDSLSDFARARFDVDRALTISQTESDFTALSSAWNDVLESAVDDFSLIYAYAGLGWEDSLTALSDRLRQQRSSDLWLWPEILYHLAASAAIAGQYENALALLTELSRHEQRARFSHGTALQWFVFDPLRDDPRFQKLVENW